MRDIPLKVDNVGDVLPATDFNSFNSELENIVTSSGQTLDPAGGPDTDLNMLGQAAGSYGSGGEYYQDSGTPNSYVLSRTTNLKNPPTYFDGMTVTFVAGNTNTTGCIINVAGFGAKNLTTADGSPLPAGAITVGGYVRATYRLSTDRFETFGTIVLSSGSPVISGKTFLDTSSTGQTKDGSLTINGTLQTSGTGDITSSTNITALGIIQATGAGSIRTTAGGNIETLGGGNISSANNITAAGQILATGGGNIETTGFGDIISAGDLQAAGDLILDSLVQPKRKIINLGDWDMSITGSVSIAHGLTLSNIRGAKAMVRNDANDLHSDIYGSVAGVTVEGWIDSIDATNITLSRRINGEFDNVNYDSTSYNRGWITIDYV